MTHYKVWFILVAVLAWGVGASSADAQIRATKRLTIGKMREMSRDAGSAAGDVAKEELQSYEAGMRTDVQKFKNDLPGRAMESFHNIRGTGDSMPKLSELIQDPQLRAEIEDRRNKKRFVDLLREWWLLPSDADLRLKAELERLRRMRAGIDSSQYRYPKQINGREVVIFGWHPTWSGGAYKDYNYQRLSHISFYSYDIDPYSGSYVNPEVVAEFRKGDFISHVRKTYRHDSSHCKVLLSLSLHGIENTTAFLNPMNATAQQVLVDSVTQIIYETQADGIEINFLDIDRARKGDFERFVAKLSNAIHKLPTDSIVQQRYVFLSMLPNDVYNVYDMQELYMSVDYYVLLGFNFHNTPQGIKKMPVSPLNYNFADRNYDLRAAIEQCIVEVGPFNSHMLVLALPYYGTMWRTQGGEDTFVEELSYSEIMRRFVLPELYSESDSVVIHSSYEPTYTTYRWQIVDSSITGQPPVYTTIFYDDTLSLMQKYDLIFQSRLGGVGLWALGDDAGFDHFWKILDLKFTDFVPPTNEKLAKLKAGNSLTQEYAIYALAVLLYWGIFMAIGFVWALFDVPTRQGLFNSAKFRTMFVSFFTLLLIMLGNYFDLFHFNIVLLISGLAIGSLISWTLLKSLHKQLEEQP